MLHADWLRTASLAVLSLVFGVSVACSAEPPNAADVTTAMRKAATFYRGQVAVHGGYVYHYSLDLEQRWGEGLAGPHQIWVQPPGTPTVGMAYLKAYDATGDAYYLEGAREAAEALVYGQLQSGGWSNSIDLESRVSGAKYRGGAKRREGTTSLDDGQTQSAIQLLVAADKAFDLPGQVQHILDGLDEQGRWVSKYGGEPLVGQPKLPLDSPYLSSEVFSRNLTTLGQYLAVADTIAVEQRPPSGRKWTDLSGQFSVDAELVEVSGKLVKLRRTDGSVVSVPISKLCDEDRRFLASLQAKPSMKQAAQGNSSVAAGVSSSGTAAGNPSHGDPPTAARLTGGLTLVKDGKPVSVIVTGDRPSESQSLAAVELQEHLRIMTGGTVPIVKESEVQANGSKVLVLVGPSDLARQHGVDTKGLEPESFIVKTTKDALILAGEDRDGSNPRYGTLWAVYDFLQDQLGCRWIWPGEIGRVVPRSPTVVVGSLDIREAPTIKIRGFRMAAQEKHRIAYEKEGLDRFLEFGDTYEQVSEDERVWLRRMRMGRSFKLSYGHAFTDWWEKYKDSDPEVFALQPNGQRGPRKSSQPDFVKMCVSNPRLWELQLASLRKYAAQGARGQWLNACENDGSGGFCVCARCRAWDADPNDTLDSLPPVQDGSDVDQRADGSDLPESLSDRYARWYNELARRARESDPDARVIAYGYSRYRSPPTRLARLEPNIWIGYVGFNAYPRPDEYREMSTGEWFGWSRLGATIFLRSNSMFYCGEGAPYVVSHQLAEDLKFQVENGLQATDYDNLQGYWATTGPSYYVLARMLWDTDADVDQVLDEFYSSFGPMEQAVKEYFEYWEQYTERLGNDPRFFELKRPDRLRAYRTIYSEAVLTAAQAILNRAHPALSEATDTQRERFRNIELGLQHGRLLAAALQDGKTSNGPEGERLMAFRREVASRNVINVYWTTSKEKRYRVFD